MKTLKASILVIAIAALAGFGCKKTDEGGDKPTTDDNKPAEPAAKADDKPAEPAAKADDKPAVADGGDYIKILASHAPEPKPTDPVTIEIKSFTVIKADFDPKNLEGATAELELDLASIDSGLGKRDGHLKSPDYLDIAKFAKATVKVSAVKKDGDGYVAKAEVDAHGVKKTLDITFEVTEATDDSVKIKGSHKFKRADFSLGKEEKDPSSQDLELQLALTFKKA